MLLYLPLFFLVSLCALPPPPLSICFCVSCFLCLSFLFCLSFFLPSLTTLDCLLSGGNEVLAIDGRVNHHATCRRAETTKRHSRRWFSQPALRWPRERDWPRRTRLPTCHTGGTGVTKTTWDNIRRRVQLSGSHGAVCLVEATDKSQETAVTKELRSSGARHDCSEARGASQWHSARGVGPHRFVQWNPPSRDQNFFLYRACRCQFCHTFHKNERAFGRMQKKKTKIQQC